MSKLLECLRRRGPGGIPPADARQLFLWLYCTTSIVPPTLADEPLDRHTLVATFSALTAEGVIRAESDLDWNRLVEDLLNSQVSLDASFPERAQSYVGS